TQRLDGGVAAEGDKSPEDEQVRHPHPRLAAEHAPLQDDVDGDPCEAAAGMVDGKHAGGRGDGANTRGHLHGTRADAGQHERPEEQRARHRRKLTKSRRAVSQWARRSDVHETTEARRSKDEWRALLPPDVYSVLFEEATE